MKEKEREKMRDCKCKRKRELDREGGEGTRSIRAAGGGGIERTGLVRARVYLEIEH